MGEGVECALTFPLDVVRRKVKKATNLSVPPFVVDSEAALHSFQLLIASKQKNGRRIQSRRRRREAARVRGSLFGCVKKVDLGGKARAWGEG